MENRRPPTTFRLGPLPARWSLEEFISTPGDDDVKFVGSMNDTGLFTPNIEGPEPARKKAANNFPTNNWGDVWVVANYNAAGRTAMKARSYLVVTIPVYMRTTSRRWANERSCSNRLHAPPTGCGEYHAFESAGARFLYLVPSGAIFGLDALAEEIVDRLG